MNNNLISCQHVNPTPNSYLSVPSYMSNNNSTRCGRHLSVKTKRYHQHVNIPTLYIHMEIYWAHGPSWTFEEAMCIIIPSISAVSARPTALVHQDKDVIPPSSHLIIIITIIIVVFCMLYIPQHFCTSVEGTIFLLLYL